MYLNYYKVAKKIRIIFLIYDIKIMEIIELAIFNNFFLSHKRNMYSIPFIVGSFSKFHIAICLILSAILYICV